MNIDQFIAPFNSPASLKDYPTTAPEDIIRDEAEKKMKKNIKKMAKLQDKMYAHDKHAILIIYQAMDAAGKDSAIKNVMSGLNPQGTQVYSFKQPSAEELDHDFLWRFMKSLPERGRVGIFNRSYYENVLVVKLHNLIHTEKIPTELITNDFWKKRYRQIRDFEKYLYENGIHIIKFFLHISNEEQRQRFLRRIDDPNKNWKFSASDLKEREHWDEYQKVYEDAITETSRKIVPWYIIPSDDKWFSRFVMSEVIIKTMKSLEMEYPTLTEEKIKNLEMYKSQLEQAE